MELNTPLRASAVFNAHDPLLTRRLGRPSRHIQRIWNVGHQEGVITRREERRRYSFEQAGTVVLDRTRPSMPRLGGGLHNAALDIAETLMPEAHTQQGDVVIECRSAYSEIRLEFRSARSGRDDQRLEVLGSDRKPPRVIIVANHLHMTGR